MKEKLQKVVKYQTQYYPKIPFLQQDYSNWKQQKSVFASILGRLKGISGKGLQTIF